MKRVYRFITNLIAKSFGMKIFNMDILPRYFKECGAHWLLIEPDYFETILVDFFGRPYGWWHHCLLYEEKGKFGLIIKPKSHNNRHGYARDAQGNFRKVYWIDPNKIKKTG